MLLCLEGKGVVQTLGALPLHRPNGEFGEARAELARGARPYGEAS